MSLLWSSQPPQPVVRDPYIKWVALSCVVTIAILLWAAWDVQRSAPEESMVISPATEINLDKLATLMEHYEGVPGAGIKRRDGTYIKWQTTQEAHAAVVRQLRLDLVKRGLTLDQLMDKWCSPGPCAYAEDLMEELK